jgi:predicted metal-dependent hydrolase
MRRRSFNKPTLKTSQIDIEGIKFQIDHKKIRSFRIKICSRKLEVKVSTPLKFSQRQIRSLLEEKLDWVKSSLEKFQKISVTENPKIAENEIHYLLGKKYALKFLENSAGKNRVEIKNNKEEMPTLEIFLRSNFEEKKAQKILENFYRQKLEELAIVLMEKWQNILEVSPKELRIRKMISRWGTCNIRTRCIYLSLELAKKPVSCLEYIIVHELTHLIEKYHNRRFYNIMSSYLPDWKERKRLLTAPIIPGV